MTRLYEDLADWWPLMSAPADYAEEAAYFARVLCDAVDPPPASVLELGSGGGNNACHLKKHFSMTLVDRSPRMLEVSGQLNADCQHVEGDMRTVRLDREFDAVFVHDAIMYMLTEDDLRAALATAAAHTRQRGVCVVVPDATHETLHFGSHSRSGDDPATGRSLRYLEWTLPPAAGATFQEVHFVFMLRERDDARVRVVHDVHRFGRFPRATWLRLLDDVGFAVTVHPLAHEGGLTAEAFVGVRR